MWIADGAMGGAIIKFDPKTEKFTFYSAVQRGDLPKIEITREAASGITRARRSRARSGCFIPT
jgi:hypothetical protein